MKVTYLYQYFDTYPGRVFTFAELAEARIAGSHSQMTLSEMIEDGLAEGWLVVKMIKDVKHYSKTRTPYE